MKSEDSCGSLCSSDNYLLACMLFKWRSSEWSALETLAYFLLSAFTKQWSKFNQFAVHNLNLALI